MAFSVAVGVPVVIHDYTHNRHPGACQMSDHIPRDVFAHTFKELTSKLEEHLATVPSPYNSTLRGVQSAVYGNLGDGRVRERVSQVLDQLLNEAVQDKHARSVGSAGFD